MPRRLDFVEDAARGLHPMTELCARYGIRRRVGYKWKARYDAGGPDALGDRRRVAVTCPHRVPGDVAARLLACRHAHPTWGPRKLLAYLGRRHSTTRSVRTKRWRTPRPPSTIPRHRGRIRAGCSTRSPRGTTRCATSAGTAGRRHNAWVNVSHVLAEEYVGLEEVDDGVWSVYFGPVLLGRFDERDLRIHGAHNRNKLPRR